MAVVKSDLTFTAYHVADVSKDGHLEIGPFEHIAAPKRGLYASLQNGFWFVRDRLRRPRLEQGMVKCVEKLVQKCSSAVEAIGAERNRDEENLPPVHEPDFWEEPISILHNQSQRADEPLADDDVLALKKCSRRNNAIRACLTSIPGWSSGKVNPASIWGKCRDALMALRSATTIAQARVRTETMIPCLINKDSAQEYKDCLLALVGECSDFERFLPPAWNLEDLDVENGGEMLSFASQLLGKLTTVSQLLLCKLLFFWFTIWKNLAGTTRICHHFSSDKSVFFCMICI